MGFLNFLFTKKTIDSFNPDFSKPEYDNWINYLNNGGTTEQWNRLIKENNWKFVDDEVEKHFAYEREFRPVFNEYHKLLELIKHQWSDLYKSKNYDGKLATRIEKECREAISYYEMIKHIDLKHGQAPLNGSPAFTKLALLYERREDYEKAILVCKQAISQGMDERSRLTRMIKKARRAPTTEEIQLLN